jgi:hypothetical protein
MKHTFTKGNNYGKGRPKHSRNKVNKEALIELVNLCTEDLKDNFDNLKTYEKIKLVIAFQNIYRDAITDISEQITDNNITITIVGNESTDIECT